MRQIQDRTATTPTRTAVASRGAVLCAAALLTAGLAGCSAAGDIAAAAGQGASSAAVGAARDAALQQVCGAVDDGRLSEEDLTRLRAAVRAAEAAGVEPEVVEQADTVLGQEGGIDEGQVEQLRAACARSKGS